MSRMMPLIGKGSSLDSGGGGGEKSKLITRAISSRRVIVSRFPLKLAESITIFEFMVFKTS